MSAYEITVDDLRQRLTSKILAAVTDDVTGRTIDEALVLRKIAEAEATFHSYAGTYYVTPIGTSSEAFLVAKKVIIDLAAWELLSRRPHAVAGETGETERRRFNAALSWLRDLASTSRKTRLVGAAESPAPTSRPSGGAAVMSDEATFTAETMASY